MNKLAIVTIFFDYPDHFVPVFENKLLKTFNKDHYYLIRYYSENDKIRNESYYFKFTYFRIRKFIEFVKEYLLNKYEYFILLDATDVGYVGNIDAVPSIMDEYNCDILFGAERNLWPDTEYSHLYANKNIQTLYKYLNAGTFCAKTSSYIDHAKSIIDRKLFGLCDQGNWQIEYLLGTGIEIDFKTKLVLNTYLAKNDITINGNKIIFNINTPIFVHDNGGFNDDTIKLMEFFQ